MISVTKFLRVLSFDEQQKENGGASGNYTNNAGKSSEARDPGGNDDSEFRIPLHPGRGRPLKSTKMTMDSIAEEQDLKDITSEIGDVSLKESDEEAANDSGDSKRKWRK